MNKIDLDGNIVNYISEYHTTHQDKSWILDLDSVAVIGGISLMDGDDDSDFLILIDKALNKHFLNLTREIEGLKKLQDQLESNFKLELNDWSIDFYDNDKVIFPENLYGHQLYQRSLKKKLRTTFAIDHAADGELAAEIVQFIKNKNTPADKA